MLPANITERARTADEYRKFDCRFGVIKNVSGSAYVKQGGTQILVTVVGPKEMPKDLVKQSRGEEGVLVTKVRRTRHASSLSERDLIANRQRISFNIPSWHGKDNNASLEEAQMQKQLTNAISPAVQLLKYKRSLIEVSCVIIEDDGGILAGLINATTLALIDSKIEMYDIAIATTVTLMRNNELLVDAAHSELNRKEMLATITYALLPNIQQISAVHLTGSVTADECKLLTTYAHEASAAFAPQLRKKIVQSLA